MQRVSYKQQIIKNHNIFKTKHLGIKRVYSLFISSKIIVCIQLNILDI